MLAQAKLVCTRERLATSLAAAKVKIFKVILSILEYAGLQAQCCSGIASTVLQRQGFESS